MRDWSAYRREHVQPVIVSPRGNLTNHHWTADGLIGERVKPDEAEFVVRTVTTVERCK